MLRILAMELGSSSQAEFDDLIGGMQKFKAPIRNELEEFLLNSRWTWLAEILLLFREKQEDLEQELEIYLVTGVVNKK